MLVGVGVLVVWVEPPPEEPLLVPAEPLLLWPEPLSDEVEVPTDRLVHLISAELSSAQSPNQILLNLSPS